MAESSPINVEPRPDANVATSRKANWWLIGLGAFLVLVFIGGVVYSRAEGSETVEKSPPASSGQAQAAEKTTETKNVPSETLLTAVLGTGAALIVIGALYGRISTIKLPGGVEISMSKEVEEKTIEESVRKHPDDPAKAAKVAQKAQALLLEEKAPSSALLTETEIGDAVDRASAALT